MNHSQKSLHVNNSLKIEKTVFENQYSITRHIAILKFGLTLSQLTTYTKPSYLIRYPFLVTKIGNLGKTYVGMTNKCFLEMATGHGAAPFRKNFSPLPDWLFLPAHAPQGDTAASYMNSCYTEMEQSVDTFKKRHTVTGYLQFVTQHLLSV